MTKTDSQPTGSAPLGAASLLMHLRGVAGMLFILMGGAATPAWSQDNGLTVSVPNGYANITAVDLSVRSTAGQVQWTRVWDGQEWKFNPHWESLSQSWKNMTGSQTADTTAGTVSASGSSSQLGSNATFSSTSSSGSGDGGCWVWVDEDWAPTQVGSVLIGGQPDFGPMMAERMSPFNRLMGEDEADYPEPVRVSVDYASLCAGSMIAGGGLRDTEGIRRANELYLGDGGRYAFSNREVLEKRSVRQLPVMSASSWYSNLGTGQISVTPETNTKGFRWMDKSGDWIDYDTQGQVVAWGDRNDNIVWLARDGQGIVRGVVDAQGRVLFSLHYNGALVSEIRDYPMAGNSLDLPSRTIKYYYDERNRLTRVVDVLGNDGVRYEYNVANRITKITDAEDRVEQLEYSGETVTRHTARDGAVTDYVFEYDDTNKQFASKISGPETEAGRKVEDFTHNRSSKLVRRIVNGQTFEEVRYDTGNRVELNTNARGFVTRATRNEFDQVVRVDLPDGGVVQRSFSALHLQPVEEIDELGIKTQLEYDTRGNLIKRVQAVGLPEQRITEYTRDAAGGVTRITYKGRVESDGSTTPDATWQLDYDTLGLVNRTTDPEGNVRHFIHGRDGSLVRYVDARGNAWNYQLDAAGNLLQLTDALGRTSRYSYDKVGNQTELVDARGKATLAVFDAMSRGVHQTSSVNGVYQISYNGQGLPVSETDEDGIVSRAEFDNFLRLSKEIDGLGNVTEYSYTIADGSDSGSLGALFDPTEIRYPTFTQRNRLDERERTTSETLLNPNREGTEGLQSLVSYDKRGRMSSQTDAYGKTRHYAYNALGQLLEVIDSLGAKTRSEYDARGNLLAIVDANGNRNRFEYDRNDRVVKEILPLGQATQYAYNASGYLERRTDANGNTTQYDYDVANRLVEVRQYLGGSTLQRTTNYSWDATNNLVAWTDRDATRPTGQDTSSGSADYDDANRKTRETVNYPNPQGGSFSMSYGYTYSPAGRKTSLVWADGSTISYGYSAHGILQTVTIPGQGAFTVDEYKWTVPKKLTLPGGGVQESSYDGLLNLEGLQVRTPGQETVLNIANNYGKVQELKTSSRVDTLGSISSRRDSSYIYDFETRLTQSSTELGSLFGTDTESFTLDAVGNRVAYSKVNGAWEYDANNRLLRRGEGSAATHFEYNAVGNLIRKTEAGGRVIRYDYDVQNRLVAVSDGDGSLLARYGYDPLDRRLWREQYRARNGSPLTRAVRHYYLYSEEGLIAEAGQDIVLAADNSVSAGAEPSLVTQFGPRPDAEFTTGILFAKARNSNDEAVYAYYHHDQMGSPLQATDASGRVVWAATYDSHGRATITTPAATAAQPTIVSELRLPGQVEDSETGLHYNYRRYYDPETGRYITLDPIGLAGGTNRYLYVEANPINLFDPTGECPMCVAYAACVAECMLEDVVVNAVTGECNNFGDSAKNCALQCALGFGIGKFANWAKKAWDRLPCGLNSFTADTVVHVRPKGAQADDSRRALTELKPISQLRVGDEVLAYSDWKKEDERLSYEKVTDVFTSYRQQVFIGLTLADGRRLEATEGHSFYTSEGWRDAGVLRKGARLLLKGAGSDGATKAVQVVDVSRESRKAPAINLEVANAHTYFTGAEGVLTHNHGNSKGCNKFQYLYEIFNKKTGKTEKYGVTSTPPNSKGDLPRPKSQLGPDEDYRVVDTANNRNDILQKERDAVQDYRDNNNDQRPPRNKRP